ncbi:acetolactate synthase small subunit [Candidatus Hecatella orcuttiae]|uniref:acetolactate synthase small subunit n=1 Tax=Candidatus Hecatella orcuttiae TaxID=1935119 RepID=UPI0028681C15|nr:acetolactate synthase small subunit [Candidatus Hecatella orcuttiae]
MSQEPSSQIIATIVENKPGVLFKVTNMIRRRGHNIDSISVGALEGGKLARMTLVIRGDEWAVEQIVKNLYKLVETVKVTRLNPKQSVLRELALIKVHVKDSKARSDLIHFSRIYRARVVDVTADSMVIEITGEPRKIDAFLDLIKEYGVKEMARTGITALLRGSEAIKV